MADVDALLRVQLDQADRLLMMRGRTGRVALRELRDVLREADRRLGARLRREARRFGTMDARFSGANALAYRRQTQLVLEYVQLRLRGMTDEQARTAIDKAYRSTVRTLEALEQRFTGIATPLRLRQAAVMEVSTRGVRASLLRQHRTSVDRYGTAMIREFERQMQIGMVEGLTQWEMIAALTGHGGPTGVVSRAAQIVGRRVVRMREGRIPEGLFARYQYWAERIVRTELAHAYNEASLASLYAARTDMPDMKKKILAHFDSRTAADSIGVHGQIRRLDDYFQDGAGRVYLRPPARPNDRETIIPWRDRWPETPETQPSTVAQIERARRLATGQEPQPREHRALNALRESAERAHRATARVQAAAVAAAVPAPRPAFESFAPFGDLGSRHVSHEHVREGDMVWGRTEAGERVLVPVRVSRTDSGLVRVQWTTHVDGRRKTVTSTQPRGRARVGVVVARFSS